MSSVRCYLLRNASATGAAFDWEGGLLGFTVQGTFSGATVTLQLLGPDDTNYVAVGSTTTVTAEANATVYVPRGKIRCLVASGSPSALYAVAAKIPT